ncbi:MAG: FAD-binding oxidoreductase [Acidobacteriia bacterium]|nr:FAD-binding oxidoreductase [Terriglobia bacterium]
MTDITDASGYAGRAEQVFTPRSEDELAAILARASSEGVPVTIMGALTGLAGGAVPKSGWAISMAQFRKLDVYPGKARVGTGVLLRDVQGAATTSGQFYAPDPTENTSSIGGNIGANASGSRSFMYGATRRHVQAVRVVHMDGRITEYRRGQKVDFDVPRIPLPRTRKHSAGYRLEPGMDFIDLFVGSEGTLGVVTEAELQLLPAPGEILGGVVFFPTEEAALDAVDRWRPTPGLRMLEFLDSRSIKLMEQPYGAAVLVEMEGDAELDMTGALEDESWFGSSAADRERFRQFRHRLPERIHERLRRGGFVVLATDYAVPLERNRDILAIYRSVLTQNFGDKFVMFGHIGDAHVHTEVLPETTQEWKLATDIAVELAKEVVAMGGTVGAEHGLGKRKAHLLSIQYNPEQIEAMRSVKRRFDPQQLLGQGNLFV